MFLSIIVKLNTEKVVADGYADEKMTFWVRHNKDKIFVGGRQALKATKTIGTASVERLWC